MTSAIEMAATIGSHVNIVPPEISFADLHATVFPTHVPAGLAEELPVLYSSLCSTQEWFRNWDEVTADGACTLSDPRHVLLFTIRDGTIEILNKVFAIAPRDAERACRALFRAFPHVHRIHLEVMFVPQQLMLPHRVLYDATHMIIDLPDTVDEYRASLSKSMRKSLNYNQRRLERDFREISTTVSSMEARRVQELYDLFADWKTTRFQAHGRALALVGQKLVGLLNERGEAHMTLIDGQEAAVKFVFPVGNTVHIEQDAFDPIYEPYGLGTVTSYWTVCAAIESGMKRVSFMWGREPHKERLGARPQRAFRLSVFRSQLSRLRSLEEAREVLIRNADKRGKDIYWRSRRHAVSILRERTPLGNKVLAQKPIALAAAGSDRTRPSQRAFHYDDLHATVRLFIDPSRYAAELDALYSSLFATVDWFETHDDPRWIGACTLEHPRHVLLFTGRGDTVDVLNKEFAIPSTDVERACRALFRSFPHVRRIHFEVMFDPRALRLAKRVLYATDHMIIDLPATVDDYEATMSRSKHLRRYRNRVARDFRHVTTEILPPDDRVPELLDRLIRWKTDSFEARDKQTYWQANPQLVDRFKALLDRRGEVRLTSIDEKLAAIAFDFPVGDCLCAQESAVDPAFDRYGLAMLNDYWGICNAISRGFRSYNLLWGTEEFKSRMGAVPRRFTALSVFRDQRSRLCSLDEAWETFQRDARCATTGYYWRARHAMGSLVRERKRGGRAHK